MSGCWCDMPITSSAAVFSTQSHPISSAPSLLTTVLICIQCVKALMANLTSVEDDPFEIIDPLVSHLRQPSFGIVSLARDCSIIVVLTGGERRYKSCGVEATQVGGEAMSPALI